MQNATLRLKAVSFLILYNLMFILPLVTVFALSVLGVSSQKFNDFLKKNIGVIKLLLCLLFLVLGTLLLNQS
jgi:predicted tellurium resistance membrane protein TerC